MKALEFNEDVLRIVKSDDREIPHWQIFAAGKKKLEQFLKEKGVRNIKGIIRTRLFQSDSGDQRWCRRSSVCIC